MHSACITLLSVLLLALNIVVTTSSKFSTPILGAYFPNWAQYRAAPYTFTPSSLDGIISKVDVIWYAFAYFCPDSNMIQPYWVTQLGICNGKSPFQLASPEPKDPQFYSEIVGLKASNPDLKVVLSVGGWNFPSNYFSGMVSTASNRQVFINSCMAWMSQYGFDGIDLDWEYPCSPPRQDYVKITCTDFDTEQVCLQRVFSGLFPNPEQCENTVFTSNKGKNNLLFILCKDSGGGSCDSDRANFLELVKEMRSAFGESKIISIAGQADSKKLSNGFDVSSMSEYIDIWNIMAYDYTVSDTSSSSMTAPNQPLSAPSTTSSISQDNVESTINTYLKSGADPSQLVLGIAYYGHTWYLPGMSSGSMWQAFGLTATIQGECCGPFASTYGGKYGEYSQLCGSYMYGEIVSAGFTEYYDNITKSYIGYMTGSSQDGYTAPGIWISYNDEKSVKKLVSHSMNKNMSGIFAFDISMDTPNTFTLTNYIYDELNGQT